MSPTVEAYRTRAREAIEAGRMADAAQIFDAALAVYPRDAALWNSAGTAAMQAQDPVRAAALYERASQLAPTVTEFCVNHAIALGRFGRHHEALRVLRQCKPSGQQDPRYCSARGNAALQAGCLAEAAQWYDTALVLDPAHTRSLQGRARVALERAEPETLKRMELALDREPGVPELWLGKAQALDVLGRTGEARAIMQTLTAQLPQWLDGLSFLSQLLLADGEQDFSAPYRDAAERVPNDPRIATAHCSALAGLDRFAEAAEIAAAARLRFPEDPRFALLEASHASEAGQDGRAEAIWAQLQPATAEHALHEARHRLRRGETDRAAILLDRVIAEQPDNVAGWALQGLVWRLRDDPRREWLHEQAGLVQFLPLRNADELLPHLVPVLHALHDQSAPPLGQSLRGGTQTRGGLLDRHEPLYRRLEDAIGLTLADYRTGLPARDDGHPLLRHRAATWKVAGSWSVRLSGGGDHHASHIHSRGIISSALYLDLPDDIDRADQPGWLEIGRPPRDLRLDLPPLRTIRPRIGHLALFPSTLYHGTRPFEVSHRMTVAFDVQTADEGVG